MIPEDALCALANQKKTAQNEHAPYRNPETGKHKRKVHLQTDLLVRLVILAPSGFIINTINTVATDKTVVLMIVCMYVCVYVCMYVCIYVCMYVCMYV